MLPAQVKRSDDKDNQRAVDQNFPKVPLTEKGVGKKGTQDKPDKKKERQKAFDLWMDF